MIESLRPLLHWTEAIIVGILLYMLGPASRRIVGALQLKRAWRERFIKFIPTLQILAWSIYGIWLINLLVTDRITPNVIAVGVVVGLVVFASWFAIRDVIGGAVLRTEAVYEPGEWVRVGETAGRITNVGARSLEIEKEDGKRLRIPYSLMAGAAIVKSEPVGTATAHSFTVNIPRTLAVAEAKSRIQRAVLFSVWSSTARPPRVETTTPTQEGVELAVTIYAIHPDYDLAVENAVRTVLGN